MFDLRHSAAFGKSENNEEKDVFSKTKIRYEKVMKFFAFFQRKNFSPWWVSRPR